MAETLIRVGMGPHLITVGEGKVLTISNIDGSPHSGGFLPVTIRKGGAEVTSRLNTEFDNPTFDLHAYAFAGPCVLEFTATNLVVTYQLFTASNIHTLLVTPTNTPPIEIRAGEHVSFFTAMHTYGWKLEKDGASATVWDLSRRQFDGPLTIRAEEGAQVSFWRPGAISYVVGSPATVLPDKGVLAVERGSLNIALERSPDLTNWSSISLQPFKSGRKEFICLRAIND
ncbi:MAG TPA: hypothetical protein VEH27_00950 [Methylomirabilota bacterium]|nr:hypothetical protein [Methylomirabilota bacterium]